MKKNDIVHLTIEDMGTNGEGIGKYNGMPFFVSGAVIGDRITAGITKLKKHYGYARLINIEQPSPDRVDPCCSVAAACGGCSLMHVAYERQLAWKEAVCDNALRRIGGIEEAHLSAIKKPITGMEEPFCFRNKSQYPVGRDREGHIVIGFYAKRSHRIIPLVYEEDNKAVLREYCWIAQPEDGAILQTILSVVLEQAVSVYDEQTGEGMLRHILIRHARKTGEVMVCLVINGSTFPAKEQLVGALQGKYGICSIVSNSNRRRDNVILGEETRLLWGKDKICDLLLENRFLISARSFYQVNPGQTEKLYQQAIWYANLTGEEYVWDLYCGIGTISLCMARQAKQVIGIEVVPEAVADARENAGLNGIDNVLFLEGRAEDLLDEVLASYGSPDVVVVDPPRKGLDEEAIRVILAAGPKRLVYVSCNPATLARDIKLLSGYSLESYGAYDQFCHSSHVETVVLLSRERK